MATRLGNVFPTLDLVQHIGEVEPVDYDVLVTGIPVPRGTHDHLFVLAVDWTKAEVYGLGNIDCPARPMARAGFEFGTSSREFMRPELPSNIAELVENVIEPGVQDASYKRVITCFSVGVEGRFNFPWQQSSMRPFLLSSDGNVIAGSFERSDQAQCWALPNFVHDLLPWAAEAVSEWRQMAPERFPASPNWLRDARWASPAELDLLARSQHLRDQYEHVRSQLNASIHKTAEELQALQVSGDESYRLLLTAHGDALVQEVARSLTTIGFRVDIVDESGPAEKVEDLRVIDPSDNWLALVEVKGYTRGAKAGDLLQIGKFQALFAAKNGRLPDACWYVVNQQLTQDPQIRGIPLRGADDQLNVFAANGGLVLEGRTLFDLRLDVELSATRSEEARKLLRDGQGHFAYTRRTRSGST